jgi:cytoskeletal protein RodZ
MASDRTSDFGGKLREARERRGISLRQIANATKISVGVLEALERNDISRLPGGIFGRAFVRSYAVEVGLDPEQTIQDFIAQFPHDSVTAGHPTSAQIEDNEAVESDRRTASTFLRLILISVPIATLVVYLSASGRFSRRNHAPEPNQPKAVTPAPEVPAAADPVPTPSPSPAVTPSPTPKPAERLTVAVTATRACWVSARVDGQLRLERLLEEGERQTLDVKRDLVLKAGDAAAITLTINGAAAKPLGGEGEAVTVRINPANFKSYLSPR